MVYDSAGIRSYVGFDNADPTVISIRRPLQSRSLEPLSCESGCCTSAEGDSALEGSRSLADINDFDCRFKAARRS